MIKVINIEIKTDTQFNKQEITEFMVLVLTQIFPHMYYIRIDENGISTNSNNTKQQSNPES